MEDDRIKAEEFLTITKTENGINNNVSEKAKEFLSSDCNGKNVIPVCICGPTRMGKSTLLNVAISFFEDENCSYKWEKIDKIRDIFQTEYTENEKGITKGKNYIIFRE